MSLDHILLGLLREPATGYDLKGNFEQTIRHFWSAELSQIYPTLKRLEQKGLLDSRVEPSSKGPERRVYRLTPPGRAELRRWLRTEPRIGSERFAYLAQLYFMDAIGSLAETRVFIVELRERHARWLDQLKEIERKITDTYGDAHDRYSETGIHRYASLRMGIHSVGAKVTWCDETLAVLDRRLAREREGGQPVPQEV